MNALLLAYLQAGSPSGMTGDIAFGVDPLHTDWRVPSVWVLAGRRLETGPHEHHPCNRSVAQ